MPTQPDELVTDRAAVLAILADPAYVVPPAPPVPATEHRTLAWLRANVARFCEGPDHDHRRALVEQDLATLDPARLRDAAAGLTRSELAAAAELGEEPFDAMAIARRVPVAVLAEALGVAPENTPDATAAVLASASGYPNPAAAGPDADQAVKTLTDTVPGDDPELQANRIGLLEQACDATAALIGNALIAAFTEADDEIDRPAPDDLVARTLTDDPPVRRTRRLSPDGAAIVLDLTPFTFGAGRRPCPGADQATALAAGVVGALLAGCELADQQLSYADSPNLRIPKQLLVTRITG